MGTTCSGWILFEPISLDCRYGQAVANIFYACCFLQTAMQSRIEVCNSQASYWSDPSSCSQRKHSVRFFVLCWNQKSVWLWQTHIAQFVTTPDWHDLAPTVQLCEQACRSPIATFYSQEATWQTEGPRGRGCWTQTQTQEIILKHVLWLTWYLQVKHRHG